MLNKPKKEKHIDKNAGRFLTNSCDPGADPLKTARTHTDKLIGELIKINPILCGPKGPGLLRLGR